ncbi:MAG: hypothetical protein J6V34_04640 [Oscillospiraceae bacterium]|nr:hypothetical protein [Oscillospiraceae bacterium]
MYKKHLKLQKFICLLCVVAAVLCFVYSLGIITDIYESTKGAIRDPEKLDRTKIPGAEIYYHMQGFNKEFVSRSLTVLLLSCTIFLTNTHARRKYYISNYVVIGAYSVVTCAFIGWYHAQIEAFKHQFLTTMDFEAMREYSEMWGTPYVDNTNLLDFHYWVAGLAIVSVVALLGNMIWKIILVRNEKKLIKAGEEAAV